MHGYVLNVLLGLFTVLVVLDRLANALLGGSYEETISRRMGRAIRERRCKLCVPVCWILGKIDRNHCFRGLPEHSLQETEDHP